ncbi:protein containing von Willebrand factor type A (vWA) domain [Desulfosporosinus orientis DSM 765]|uniref:Protein containing von Willebrand factor type A (VWA) domain n=1 Tax=Desulfosporosinus orientis (strain ATCC 19365 / DSM 765 / NCIMB 8382 / VKM B-1628 / Singapore I) TaxID=768706 RepID=G7WHR0_DESOD|nr:VWA domain-containing protein [Desulfosporosinus orientis]AET69622.1 protein containing von Willebrand factor type A (vWA) domain [Desulfosporosinus orientis DSM 765]
MEYLILDIARMLRASGISVSTQEISDCIRLLNRIDKTELDKHRFYNTVNATMIKTEWGSQYIQWLVELYLEPDEELTGNRFLELSRQVSETTGEGLGTSGQGLPVDLMIDAVLKKDVTLIYAMVKRMSLDLSLLMEDRQEALHDFKQRSGWLEVQEMVEDSFREGQITALEYDAAQESLSEWIILLKEEIEAQLIKNMSREHLTELMKKNNPNTIKFAEADSSQLAQISREVEKLGRKLAVKKGRRWKPGKKGRIHLNKSIKKAIQTGGILMELIQIEPKPSKPDLWLLCDMSNSVRRFSYFMLMFIYTIQKRFANIRSFIFVDILLEVTDFFKEQEWDKALNSLNTLKGFNLTGYSHYGNVLHQFYDANHTLLNHKTTVLILGDAKNNRNKTDGSEVLAQVKESARALYWLNPMNEDLWYSGDCVMEKYIKDCTAAYHCSNLQQLEQFVEKVF